MRRGRHNKPVITLESVQAALKLLQPHTDSLSTAQPLTQLALIDKFLATSARPSAENLRGWALNRVLSEVIHNRFTTLLSHFELTSPKATTRSTIQGHLATVFQQPSEMLKGWCLLMYRFVHAEYGFSMEEIAEITSTHPRTLRRYTRTAMFDLRDNITAQEWDVRVEQNKMWLKSQIPVIPPRLVGRQTKVNYALKQLDNSPTRPIFVSGVSGIGKTAFVATIAQYLIENDVVDFLVWIDTPRSIQDVNNRIWDVLAPHSTTGHWQDYVFDNRLLVVVDDTQAIVDEETLQVFCDSLTSHILICTQNTQPALPEPCIIVNLDALGSSEAKQLLTSVYKYSEINSEEIIAQAGGNPRLLHTVARVLSQTNRSGVINGITSDHALIAHALESDFNQLQYEQQYIWWKLTILQQSLDARWFNHTNVSILESQGVVLHVGDSLKLATPLHLHYMKQKYREDALFRRDVHTSLRHDLYSPVTPSNHEITHNNDFILATLQCSWLQLDSQMIRELATCITSQYMTAGQLREWRSAIEHLVDFDSIQAEYLDLYLTYVSVARRLRDPNTIDFTMKLIAFCGKKGEFDALLKAQYELGVFHQAKGIFEEALRLHDQVHGLLKTYPNDNLQSLLWVQQARLAIARQQPNEALVYLEKCDNQTPEIQVLYCEALYQQGMYQRGLNLVNHCLAQADIQVHIQSALHTIAGRIYQAWYNAENALVHFNNALTLAERNDDVLDMCRAHTNLISAQLSVHTDISDGEIQQIIGELERIQQQQTVIHDYVGLEATTRTLNYVESI